MERNGNMNKFNMLKVKPDTNTDESDDMPYIERSVPNTSSNTEQKKCITSSNLILTYDCDKSLNAKNSECDEMVILDEDRPGCVPPRLLIRFCYHLVCIMKSQPAKSITLKKLNDIYFKQFGKEHKVSMFQLGFETSFELFR